MAYWGYQIDSAELSRDLNMNKKSKYLLTWVSYFLKYVRALSIKNNAITLQNIIAQMFIIEYKKILKINKEKEFAHEEPSNTCII